MGATLIAAAAGCAQPEAAPNPLLAVTASDQRATSDIVPQFLAEALAGQIKVTALLGDRLERDELPGPSIRLTSTEHLFAVIGDTRVPLVEEQYPVPGFSGSILWTRYVATIVGETQQFVIEFDRADGTVVTSTMRVPARFAITSAPSADIKLGDTVTFVISPPPGANTSGYWDAWCDATPDELIYDANRGSVDVAADGQGRSQIGDVRYGTGKNCAAQLQIKLRGLGDYDPGFGSNVGPATSTHPMGLQDVDVGVHLWGI